MWRPKGGRGWEVGRVGTARKAFLFQDVCDIKCLPGHRPACPAVLCREGVCLWPPRGVGWGGRRDVIGKLCRGRVAAALECSGMGTCCCALRAPPGPAAPSCGTAPMGLPVPLGTRWRGDRQQPPSSLGFWGREAVGRALPFHPTSALSPWGFYRLGMFGGCPGTSCCSFL